MNTVPRERFFRVYANLPVGLRNQVVVVMPEIGPVSWNAVYTEINSGTKLGDSIVEKLIELEII